jgi:lysozyme
MTLKYISFLFLFLWGCSRPQPTKKEGFFYTSPKLETSESGIDFIKEKEGFSEVAYFDGALWTIGYGNTFYPDKTKVKRGDRITREEATELIKQIIRNDFEPSINESLKTELNQPQYDALVSYAYNRGLGKFKTSKLLVMVNQEPFNPAIKNQFITEWGSNSRFKNGLIRRRREEAELYFSKDKPPETKTEKPEKPKTLKLWVLIILLIGLLAMLVRFLALQGYKLSITIIKQK